VLRSYLVAILQNMLSMAQAMAGDREEFAILEKLGSWANPGTSWMKNIASEVAMAGCRVVDALSGTSCSFTFTHAF